MKNQLLKLASLIVVISVLCAVLASCGSSPLDIYEEDTSTEQKDIYYVAMHVKDYGTMIFLLDAENTPVTVNNFVSLVRSGFYDGLTFHRVIEGFMIQGGDPNGDGTGGSKDKIYGEFAENGYETNFIDHKKGVISMARSESYNSASCQFFICNATNYNVSYSLDGKYAAFGWLIEGEEVLDAITTTTAPFGDGNGVIAKKSNRAIIEEVKVIIYEDQ